MDSVAGAGGALLINEKESGGRTLKRRKRAFIGRARDACWIAGEKRAVGYYVVSFGQVIAAVVSVTWNSGVGNEVHPPELRQNTR